MLLRLVRGGTASALDDLVNPQNAPHHRLFEKAEPRNCTVATLQFQQFTPEPVGGVQQELFRLSNKGLERLALMFRNLKSQYVAIAQILYVVSEENISALERYTPGVEL